MLINTELYDSTKVPGYIEQLKREKKLLEEINIKYSLKTKFINITGKGVEVFDGALDEGYYENLEVSLDNALLSWYSPLILHLDCDTEAVIEINPDGTLVDSSVSVITNFTISNKQEQDKMPFLSSAFRKLVQLHKFIRKFKFHTHGYKLTNISVVFKIDRKGFSTALSKLESPNMAFYDQWKTILNIEYSNPSKRYNNTVDVPIQNGKMLYNIKRETISTRIKFSIPTKRKSI
ncbi:MULTISPECIES: hypothetical protein [Metabacillus]|uniref:hypothetical protein n=1 Tax=Metabacillus TaxID=2675233 RepID=UPI000C7FE35D|nr:MULTISPECIES: hypothetical protein [Metabacillus]MCM3443960.1 hypothetical protein [Metabacillus halosaccharovorans]PMC34988.1 hypothetical protein CJ195_21000 [Bacillus sp. UMB0899]